MLLKQHRSLGNGGTPDGLHVGLGFGVHPALLVGMEPAPVNGVLQRALVTILQQEPGLQQLACTLRLLADLQHSGPPCLRLTLLGISSMSSLLE